MYRLWINIVSSILFFYSKSARKKFRAAHKMNAIRSRRFRKMGLIGENTYVSSTCRIIDKKSRIGKFCSIADNVWIGTGIHPINTLTSSPVAYSNIDHLTNGIVMPDDKKFTFQGTKPVKVGNDVWIGLNVVVMGGVEIGDGAVIGSGAVVTKNIPPYAVAVGVPAKVIKYRFPEETIQRLLKTRWWDQPEDVIKSLPMDNVEECLQILEKRMKECEK